MTDMEILALQEYSRGAITRRQLEKRLQREITPADAIILLAGADLPLPVYLSPEDSPGPKLLRQILVNRKKAHG